jgi:hypothetical protein
MPDRISAAVFIGQQESEFIVLLTVRGMKCRKKENESEQYFFHDNLFYESEIKNKNSINSSTCRKKTVYILNAGSQKRKKAKFRFF